MSLSVQRIGARAAAASASKTFTLDEGQLNNKTALKVRPGDVIKVKIAAGQENDGGYRWVPSAGLGTPKTDFKSSTSADRVGAGGTYTFTYTVPANAKKGTSALHFDEKRPWETSAKPLRTLKLKVAVG